MFLIWRRSPLPYITLRCSSTASCHPCHPLPSRLAIVDLHYQLSVRLFIFPFHYRLFLSLSFSSLSNLRISFCYRHNFLSFPLSSFYVFIVSLFAIVLFSLSFSLSSFTLSPSSSHSLFVSPFCYRRVPLSLLLPRFAHVVLTLSPRSPHFIFPRRRVFFVILFRVKVVLSR